MYGLPADLDLSFLVGPRLEQVAIGENEIIFRFNGSISLTVEGAFSIGTSVSDVLFESPRDSAQRAAALIGQVVIAEQHSVSGHLSLQFGGGARLVLSDTSEQYESYQINRAEDIWIV